ncbi:MAG TPA: hypothetical protein VFE58_00365, partial [Tepidisphaeraceae bacterium]|nr:hypothetical protein [Tepidisphaeraceae bacterium]
LEAGGTETVRTIVKFANGGRQIVSAELKTAGLASENQLELPVEVREPLNVVLVCGDEQRDGRFVRLALSPFAGKDAANLGKVTLVKADDAGVSLAGADVLILANVIQPAEGMVSRIEHFVYGGGGLIIAPGSVSMAAEYTRLLYRNGVGVMPAALRAARGNGEAATTLLGLTLEHQVFRFLKGMASPVPLVSVSQYFPADLREGDSRVLGSYATGDPFLIEGSFGSGRVLLVTTSLNAEWSDLPWTNFYLPFVQSCVRYVSKGGSGGTLKVAGSGESDLTPLGEESWERLRRSLGMEEVADASGAGVLLSALGVFESELWLPLLGVVVGLMILEGLLGRAWSETGEL